jgi:prevent-host-death family protein
VAWPPQYDDNKKYDIQSLASQGHVMHYPSWIKPISDFRANAAEVLEHLADRREPMVTTQYGEARAVIQDVASCEETRETRALLNILALGHQDVAAGMVTPLAEVAARLRDKSASRK